MVRVSHNHDTSFKVLAKTINDGLKGIYSHNHSELKLCSSENGGVDRNIVSVSINGLNNDMEALISLLNRDDGSLFPRVIIAKSNTINPSQMGATSKKFQMQQSVKLENVEDKSDTISLKGQIFPYETPVQIVIMARSGFATMELGLNILNILANNHTIKYDMMMNDKEDTSKKFLLKDFATLKLANINSASFSESTESNLGFVSIAMEFNMRNSYFIFRDDEAIMKNYTVQNSYSGVTI